MLYSTIKQGVVGIVAAVSLVACATTGSFYERIEATTHSLEVNGELHCSATAVGEHTILTADHCFPVDEALTFKIGGREAKASKFARDGNDHVLILVDIAFRSKAKFASSPLRKTDRVFYYGNPGIRQLYRAGVVSGYDGNGVVLDINGWHGDSGAAVFNERGRISSAVSEGYMAGVFKLVIVYPIAFTEEQYTSLGVPL